ncbi:MAG: ATP-binding protein [Bacteroidales bacterium]|nr:ATP-binding protein [Bacteroidales bacterium]
MLVRLVVDNVFSFGEQKEFNLIPNTRLKTLNHHKYSIGNFEILKMSSIYGANGAGKSNLVKSLDLIQRIVIKEELPYWLRNTQFKFQTSLEKSKQLIAVEFIQEETAYFYAIEVTNGIISTEELYVSGLGTKEDKLIFERKTDLDEFTSIKFLDKFEKDEKSQVLKTVLLEDFVKPNESILKLLSNRENEFLSDTKKAFTWFSESLQVITPDSRPNALAQRIDLDKEFKNYAEEVMCAFNIGVTSLSTEKKGIKEFFGQDNENKLDELIKELEESPKKMIGLRIQGGDEIILVKEKEGIYVKQLKIEHKGKNNISVNFDLEDESDGTIRLLDFIPAFKDVVSRNKVFVIDEIERSIHPLLIKDLVKKFSFDKQSKGQLIFTTHESNLLDQEIFRKDEIWFAEKNKNGVSDLYSLSDFKEHKTIDIRKGYLNGRYGSIPFLANFQDLNWHKNDIN